MKKRNNSSKNTTKRYGTSHQKKGTPPIQLVVTIVLILVFVGTFITLISQSSSSEETLILATTTSTYDSGLLDAILPDFQEKTNISVQIISVGTGQAIKNGEQGNADVLLIHAPSAELKFIDDGFGLTRNCVMYNDFIIVGPISDPANIHNKTIAQALTAILSSEEEFISRGDDSGTHKKELFLWSEDNLTPVGDWYLEIGQGMGDTLRMANEKQAYTLADRGTWLALKSDLELDVLVEGDDLLLNPYGVIAINPLLHKNIHDDSAKKFITWLMSNETQDMIGAYTVDGEILFKPLRGNCLSE